MATTRYAVGVRVHSGGAAAAVATGSLQAPLILQRARLTLTPADDERTAETVAARALASFLNEGSASVSVCAILTSNERLSSEHMLREAIARTAVRFGLEVVALLEEDAAQCLSSLHVDLGPPWGRDEKLASIAALLGLEKTSLAAV